MPVQSKHKRVTWKVDRRVDQPLQPRRYVQDVALSEESAALLEGKLVPGSLFTIRSNLEVQDTRGYKPPPFPYLIESWLAGKSTIKAGSIAIYAGIVRVEEVQNATTFRAPRHSVIINGSRYLLINLNHLFPAL